jgi:uncharacterized protein
MNMPDDTFSNTEKQVALELARTSLEAAVQGKDLPPLELDKLPQRFQQKGATFITLTRLGELRGCIGTLEAYQPLAEDIREHAVAAALNDHRFPPVRPEELDQIHIEISRLTEPVELIYDDPQDLIAKLQPGIDGVVLRDGWRRATFLPQVWEKLPDPAEFLDHLCYKMGADPGLWRRKKLEIQVYHVEEFHEFPVSKKG